MVNLPFWHKLLYSPLDQKDLGCLVTVTIDRIQFPIPLGTRPGKDRIDDRTSVFVQYRLYDKSMSMIISSSSFTAYSSANHHQTKETHRRSKQHHLRSEIHQRTFISLQCAISLVFTGREIRDTNLDK